MSSIPPPPPLPPSRSSRSNAFTRFVTQSFASRPQANRVEIGKAAFVFPQKLPGLSPLSSQTSSFKVGAGSEITSLDVNKDKTHVILAGPDTLQTVRVDGKSLEEGTNIINAIVDKDRQNASRHRDTLAIRDVKWSHGSYSHCIATAASSGNVVVYDLSRPGVELARLHQHSRQVHKVAFSPFQGYLFLSASQDGTVRIWDLRAATPEVTRFQSSRVYFGESDGVRDVKWSPKDAVEFAFCTDRGSVQVWDFRQPSAAKLKFANAHDRSSTAVDWHPDGKHLLSAGQDQTVKIWDVAGDRRQKPQWQLRTPYPVLNARWRVPVCLFDDAGAGSWLCTQVATSYEKQYPVVHVWDFRRPNMPFREACNWKTAPTDMIWPSQRLLWSTHREGQFHQTDVRFAPKVIDRRPMQAMAISPSGEICVFAQRRPRTRVSDVDFNTTHSYASESMSFENPVESPELNLSRSIADDSIDDNFLTCTHKGVIGKHLVLKSTRAGGASANILSPSPEVTVNMTLPQSLNTSRVYTPLKQTAFRGYLGGTLDTAVFSYLAQKYRNIPSNFDLMDPHGRETVLKVFEDNAKYAQKSARHREAQLWRTLAQLIDLEWTRRSTIDPYEVFESLIENTSNLPLSKTPEHKSDLISPVRNPAVKQLQAEHFSTPATGQESESSVTTPVARARDTDPVPVHSPEPVYETISLPPSLVSQPEMYLSKSDIEARKAQMSSWRARPKQPLDFQLPGSAEAVGRTRPPPVERHNSNESFGMLSTSADSPRGLALAASFGNRSHRPSMSSIPEFVDPFLQDPLSLSDRPLFEAASADKSTTLKTQMSWVTSSSSADIPFRNMGTDEVALDTTSALQPGDRAKPEKITVKSNNPAGIPIPQTPATLAKKVKTREPNEIELLLHELSPLLVEHFTYYTDQLPSSQTTYHLTQSLKPIFGTPSPSATPSDSVRTPKTLPGIEFLKEEAVLSTYHDLLQALQIFNPAIELSKSSYEFHSDLFEQAKSQAGLVCLQCKKPINNSDNPLRCEHCHGRQSPCPICWQKYPAIETPRPSRKKQKQSPWQRSAFEDSLNLEPPPPISATTENDVDSLYAAPDDPVALTHQTQHPVLWQWCFVCGHGAHASCLQAIQSDGRLGGKCPTEGCLCDCIAGSYRDMLDRQAAESRATLMLAREAKLATIRRDTQRVGESRAVRTVRGMLEGDGGQASASGSGGRRVRVVEPARSARSSRDGL